MVLPMAAMVAAQAALSFVKNYQQGRVARQQALAERDRVRFLKSTTKENAFTSEVQISRNVRQMQEEQQMLGRVAIANAERDAAYRRGVAAVNAADRGVASSGGVQEALDVQEAIAISNIEDDMRGASMGITMQAIQARQSVAQQLAQVQSQADPQVPSQALILLQSMAAGGQAAFGAYTQGQAAHSQGIQSAAQGS